MSFLDHQFFSRSQWFALPAATTATITLSDVCLIYSSAERTEFLVQVSTRSFLLKSLWTIITHNGIELTLFLSLTSFCFICSRSTNFFVMISEDSACVNVRLKIVIQRLLLLLTTCVYALSSSWSFQCHILSILWILFDPRYLGYSWVTYQLLSLCSCCLGFQILQGKVYHNNLHRPRSFPLR